jgi:hypothetical protein
MILKIVSPKKMAFFAQAVFEKNDHNIGFWEKAKIFTENLRK